MLSLYNTLSHKKEVFKPVRKGTVHLYTCGPTVYDNAHIGNLRTFIFEDILRRTLKLDGYKVKHVMNITDVEDKIIKKLKASKKKNISDITVPYTKIFLEDISKLNIEHAEKIPLVTDHIKEIITLTEKLLKKGIAYEGKDGSVYFDITKFKNYGELVGLGKINVKSGARISSDEYDKTDAQDFVLWKAKKGSEPSWESPFGPGRPGWHIECSALAMKYLTLPIDIHAGGIDLVFPHHENEIAQSEGATGKKFVNYWVHGEHLLVDGKKMSKSLGNFYTLKDIEKEKINPLAFRYFALSAHYRSRINFTWKGVKAAENAINNLYQEVARLALISRFEGHRTNPKKIKEYEEKFKEALNDDLNTPQALALTWQLINDPSLGAGERFKTAMDFDKILGFRIKEVISSVKIPKKVQDLVAEREASRSSKQFVKADSLRDKIEGLGYNIEDTPKGPFVWPIQM